MGAGGRRDYCDRGRLSYVDGSKIWATNVSFVLRHPQITQITGIRKTSGGNELVAQPNEAIESYLRNLRITKVSSTIRALLRRSGHRSQALYFLFKIPSLNGA